MIRIGKEVYVSGDIIGYRMNGVLGLIRRGRDVSLQ